LDEDIFKKTYFEIEKKNIYGNFCFIFILFSQLIDVSIPLYNVKQ